MRRLSTDEAACARALKTLKPKMKLAEIAEVIGTKMRGDPQLAPSPTAICRVLKNQTHSKPRKKPTGRKRRTTPQEDALLAGIIDKLEEKNRNSDVTAKMIKEEWHTENTVSPATVSRRLREQNRKWRRPLFKATLTPAQKVGRKRFGTRHKRKTLKYWKTKAAFMDGKSYPWHTSRKARKIARTMTKRGSYRLPSEGRKYAVPSRKKHRQPAINVRVNCVVGNGKILMWRTHTSWGGEMYARHVRQIAKVLTMEGGTKLDLYRDNDPKGYATNKGKAAEQRHNLNVEPLAVSSPDCMPLDYSLWDAIDRDMKAQEKEWPEDYKEDYGAFKARLRKTAMALDSATIDKALASMQRRCRELHASGGELIKGD